MYCWLGSGPCLTMPTWLAHLYGPATLPARLQMQTKHWDLALFRTFPPSSFLETSDICALEHGVRWGAQFHPRIDPCDSTGERLMSIGRRPRQDWPTPCLVPCCWRTWPWA